ncbi:DUF485 domain-containing protein [Streptomyces gobiensis]|uniref:DUF485 domain-containing protein n=1 Tax=Streptomyces gobiensis TaxID=2875706 RepID=UPI001E2A6530|nr:DUF485 domain-containing protein [Streptomyces gobiensis]UGY90829.1 DUF485 domain-containing protein [Streptomyces gobiensis]
MSTELPPPARSPEDAVDRSVEMHSDPRFQELKRRLVVFAFPMSAAFLIWYLLYVLMSAYARDAMSTVLFGRVNVALVFGVLQFATTFGIAVLYARYANRRLDPLAEELCGELNGDGPDEGARQNADSNGAAA